MSDPITWYALGRVVDDPQSILQAVDAKMLVHNQDVSAHGQSGEGLYTHRIAALLDHVAYSIYNVKTNPAARVFKAIVGGGPDSDFANLQPALDWANIYGGGTIYIRNGTYLQDNIVYVPSNVDIIGEDNDKTILDFQVKGNWLSCGDILGGGVYNVHIKNLKVQNVAKHDRGAINFESSQDVGVENCKFYNNRDPLMGGGIDVSFNSCTRCYVERCTSSNSGRTVFVINSNLVAVLFNTNDASNVYGYRVDNGSIVTLIGNEAHNSPYSGYIFVNSTKIKAIANYAYNFGQDAFRLTGSSKNIFALNQAFSGQAGSKGFYLLSNSDRNILKENLVDSGATDGIDLESGARNILAGNIINGLTRGIRLQAGADRTIVDLNELGGNTTPFTDSGTNTQVGHNIAD